MKCPDCAGSLVEVTLSGIDKSFRCFRCGGIWVKDNTLNEMPIGALEGWRPIKFENSSLTAGENRCPQDGGEIKKFANKAVPESWNVRRCDVCKGWWWALDTLFRLRSEAGKDGGYLKAGEIIKA